MRVASTQLVEQLFAEFGPFPTPIADLGGAETNRQFEHLFPSYEIWDKRPLPDVLVSVDFRNMVSGGTVEDGHLGTLLSFDTLEHIFEFQKAVDNFTRVVRRGGLLLIGVPWAYKYHDPSGDFWRFSAQALEWLFRDHFRTIRSGFYDEQGVCPPVAAYYFGVRR